MKHRLLYLILILFAFTNATAQDENPYVTYDVPSQNLLKFNRFLINPTFSTVREDKSYINLLHRNQSVAFDDNNQTYFLSYSGRVNDRTGLGLSLYTQQVGILSNYGVLANYAYGIKLSDKSNFTFGANLSYYSSGFDQNRANPIENDPLLNGFQDSSLLSFQPGFNISYGQFDFGVFAENLFDYNLKSSESLTDFKDKTFSSHLQYTYPFKSGDGIFQDARLMPLARVRMAGQEDVVLGGNLILDLPKLGWLQGGYDSFYGASAGIGFNLNRRLSLGYTMEKGLSTDFADFGLTHEISFAYSFTPNLTEDRVMLEDSDELLADADEGAGDIAPSDKDAEIAELKRRLAENDDILAELMFRQDSLENSRQDDLERRFEMVLRMVRRETDGNRPDLEEKAKQMYFINNDKTAIAENDTQRGDPMVGQEAVTGDVNSSVRSFPGEPRDKMAGIEPKTAVRKDALATRNRTEKSPVERAGEKSGKDSFTRAIQQQGVKGQKFRNIEGVTDGYYVVANVYKGTHYLNKFVDQLSGKGINADYIDNPHNGLKYVYLQRYDTWQEALAAHKSKYNGNYEGDLWIMNVENKYTNEAYVRNTDKIKEKSAKYAPDVLRKNVVVKDNVTKATQESWNQVLSGTGSGYYIIANVFANARNANRFVRLLNSQGLSASYFINPKNNYRYVYLKRHESWNSALVSYYTKLNDAYDDKMWIMRVTPNLIT